MLIFLLQFKTLFISFKRLLVKCFGLYQSKIMLPASSGNVTALNLNHTYLFYLLVDKSTQGL